VESFAVFSWTLAIVFVVTLLWPLNLPLAALAYKVRQGSAPIDMDGREFWVRCTLASLGMFGMGLVLLGLTYGLIEGAELPREMVEMVMLLVYVPAAAWFLFWVFALEDMLQALSLFLLYILLPGVPLLLIGWLTGAWRRLADAAPWLLATT
jgi:hypothetical protein